jgi:hypothetical protein
VRLREPRYEGKLFSGGKRFLPAVFKTRPFFTYKYEALLRNL